MSRTMIWLDESIHTRLKHLAVDQRVSLAELIRRAVSDLLKKHEKKGGERP